MNCETEKGLPMTFWTERVNKAQEFWRELGKRGGGVVFLVVK